MYTIFLLCTHIFPFVSSFNLTTQVCYWALWANPGEAAGHCKLWAVLIYAERFPCVHKRQVTSLTQTYVVFQLLTRHDLIHGLMSKVDVSFCPGKLQHISLIAVKSNLFKILCHIKYVVVGCDSVALHFLFYCWNLITWCLVGRLCYINTIFFFPTIFSWLQVSDQ